MVKVDAQELPVVSVVFVSYNRPHTLVAAVETFLVCTDYPIERLELIVTDDGSDSTTIDIIEALPFDIRCYSKKNKGLGANSNKGIQAATGDYILFLQDDWIVIRRSSYLKECVAILEKYRDIGIVLIRDWGDARLSEMRSVDTCRFGILSNDPSPSTRTYSDNPHLKRRNFHEVVGWYREGVPMTAMEDEMTMRVAKQNVYKSALLCGDVAFHHIGDRYSFNPGKRVSIAIKYISKLPFGEFAMNGVKKVIRIFRQICGKQGL